MWWNRSKSKRSAKVKNKYSASRVSHAGLSFMSKGEAACYDLLKLMELSGELSDLKTQVTIRMTDADLRWIMDFSYFDNKKGCLVFADFKGFETERWAILKKLWPFYGPGPLVIYKMEPRLKRIFVHEEINIK